MVEEIKAHTENNHWEVIEITQVIEGDKIIPSVWALKQKGASPQVKCTSGRHSSIYTELNKYM